MPGKKREKESALPLRKVGRRSGLTRATFSIAPDQLGVLQAEAMERAKARGSFKPDASEVLREALAEWIKRRRR